MVVGGRGLGAVIDQREGSGGREEWGCGEGGEWGQERELWEGGGVEGE